MEKNKYKKEDLKTAAGNFIAKKISSRVKDKYKRDTDLTRKINMGVDSAKDNIKSILIKTTAAPHKFK